MTLALGDCDPPLTSRTRYSAAFVYVQMS